MEDRAKRILQNNLFMTLSTASKNGVPWITPVFFAHDEDYNFYWYSQKTTKHSQLISKNNKIAASIYAQTGEDEGIGIYIEGVVHEVGEEEVKHATEVYSEKAAQSTNHKSDLTKTEDFLGDSPLRMYKLVPSRIYISNEAKKWKGKWLDSRSEIKLKS